MQSNRKAFWCLLGAYVISLTYQFYCYTLHEHPADTFGPQEVGGYAVLMGWSALALIGKRWAVAAILVLCVLQLGIGIFYYFPVIFPTRHDRVWDWAEAVIFTGLIAYAGYRSVAQLIHGRQQLSYR